MISLSILALTAERHPACTDLRCLIAAHPGCTQAEREAFRLPSFLLSRSLKYPAKNADEKQETI